MSLNIDRYVAAAQSLHPRLGQESPMRCLDDNLLCQIFSMICEQRDVKKENHIPLFLESQNCCSYSNIKANGAGGFQYHIVMGNTVCDTGAVPVWKDDNCGVVSFFGPAATNSGSLKVTMSSMAGDESVFLEIGCWKDGVDTEPSDMITMSAGNKFYRASTSEVVGVGKHRFPTPPQFPGFVELWTE